MIVGQYRADVEEVPEAANPKGQSQANTIGYASTEESNTGKGCIEGSVGIVDVVCADQTTSSKTIHGIEHSWTEEADDGNEADLKGRRSIVR